MARVSRKKQNTVQTQVDTSVRIWKTALYVRLSVEDNGKDSDSVENQTALLEEYVANHPGLNKVAIFIDNGYTGTDFLRPEFNRMMEAVQAELIDCIVVKDLSRLGRNYIETSQFIEKICPFYGLRFIAVNDSYDTATVTSEGQLSASLSNIVNDYYAKDISRKVTSALQAKWSAVTISEIMLPMAIAEILRAKTTCLLILKQHRLSSRFSSGELPELVIWASTRSSMMPESHPPVKRSLTAAS